MTVPILTRLKGWKYGLKEVAGTDDGSIGASAEAGSKVESAWSLRRGDGSISIDESLGVSGAIREHSVRGPLGPGGPPLQLYTGDGSIRLTGL